LDDVFDLMYPPGRDKRVPVASSSSRDHPPAATAKKRKATTQTRSNKQPRNDPPAPPPPPPPTQRAITTAANASQTAAANAVTVPAAPAVSNAELQILGDLEDEEEEADEILGRARMGRPKKRVEDLSKGWQPSAEDLAPGNPSSPGRFKLWLEQKGLSQRYAYHLHLLLKGTGHDHSILDFLRDRERSALIVQSKGVAPTPYTVLIRSKAVQVAITPMTKEGESWPPMHALSPEDRSFWASQFVIASDASITYTRERASEELEIDLSAARVILATAIANAQNLFNKYSKAHCLLSLYLNFWCLRDDTKGMRMVKSREQCRNTDINYLIVPDIQSDNDWSIFVQKTKTVGLGRKYDPVERKIPTAISDAAHEYERPFVEFGKVLRHYIRNNNRNTALQPPAPFQYKNVVFGEGQSKFLTAAARALKIIGERQSFINTNRRLWDNYYYEHSRTVLWPLVVQWSFHTAAASRESYMRGDSRLGCGCADNPNRPQALTQQRTQQLQQQQQTVAAMPAATHH
jgi:hypothetical protein